MMDDNMLCLRFKRYGDNIQGFWKTLQSEKDYSDVILACGDKQLHAHKIILSFFSPIFRNILRQISDTKPFIYLTGTTYRELKILMNYMYHGEVSIRKEQIDSFLNIAQDLRILGLFEENKSKTKLELLQKDEGNNDEDINKSILSPTKEDFDFYGILMPKEDSSSTTIQSSLKMTENAIKYLSSDTLHKLQTESIENFKQYQSEPKVLSDDMNSENINLKKVIFLPENYRNSENHVKSKDLEEIIHNNPPVKNSVKKEFISVDKLVCYICKKKCSSKDFLESHIKLYHTVSTCTSCNISVKGMGSLKRHMKIHVGSNKIPCNECGLLLSGTKPLKQHFLAKHTKERPLKCIQCDFSTATNTALKYHIERKHSDNTYSCYTCGENFKTKLSIYNHERFVHKEKSFMCNHCGKYFKRESHLQKHINSLHSTVKIKCDVCSKPFPSEQYLKEHARQHDAKNFLPCTFCEKTFTRKLKLQEHINIHTGNSPFVCSQTNCIKKFKSSSSLAHHKKSCNEFSPKIN